MRRPVETPPPLVGTSSSRVRTLLASPDRAARVVHTGPQAVYLDLDGECLGVLAAGASALPCGVRTLGRLPLVTVGQTCAVGSGRIVLATTEVRVGRVVDLAVPPIPARAGRPALALHPALGATDPVRDELPAAALVLLADADPACVRDLLGLGSGLTPLGDDVLAGWLAALVAADHPARHPVAAEVTRLAPTRTTLLSATLLACAVRGEVLPEYAAVVRALDRDPTAEVDRLVAVGHTSGRGMLLGLSLALSVIDHPATATPTARRTA